MPKFKSIIDIVDGRYSNSVQLVADG